MEETVNLVMLNLRLCKTFLEVAANLDIWIHFVFQNFCNITILHQKVIALKMIINQ